MQRYPSLDRVGVEQRTDGGARTGTTLDPESEEVYAGEQLVLWAELERDELR